MKRFTKNILKIGWLFAGAVIVIFLFMVFEGPDRHYQLDENYQMWGWPGWIMKYDPVRNSYIEPIDIDSEVTAFALTGNYIVGRTSRNWFIINRDKEEVLYPFQSQKEISDIIGIDISKLSYTTTRPLSRIVLSKETKLIIPFTILFFIATFVLMYMPFYKKTKGVIAQRFVGR